MSALRSAGVNLVFWLLLFAAGAALAYVGGQWGRTGGPMAAPKWDGTYHTAPGVEAKPSGRWKERKLEQPAVSSRQ